jgi:hypothetical protein
MQCSESTEPWEGPTDGWRLYIALACLDTRNGSFLADLVRAAREGYERSELEEGAWDEFERLRARWNEMGPIRQRLAFDEFGILG